ncbi:MAG: hypothetical protein WKF86_07965 [Acidimicrobiales bacterium]
MDDAEPLILFFAALFCVVGTSFVVGGLGTRRRNRAFRAVALRVPGIVADLRYRRWGRGRTGRACQPCPSTAPLAVPSSGANQV